MEVKGITLQGKPLFMRKEVFSFLRMTDLCREQSEFKKGEQMAKKELTWQDIKVSCDGNILEFSNSFYRRVFDLTGGILRTQSFEMADGRVLCGANVNVTDFECYGNRLPLDRLDCCVERVDFFVEEEPEWESPHVLIRAAFRDPHSRTQLIREFFLYPFIGAYGLRNRVTSYAAPNYFWLNRPDVGRAYAAWAKKANWVRYNEPVMDVFHPAEGFEVRKTVAFYGHTDIHEHHVIEKFPEAAEKELSGNLLYCEDSAGTGLVMLQEAPPSAERRERETYDFRQDESGDVFSLCWGLLPEDLMTWCGEELISYRNMVGVYTNEMERDRVVKDYLRCRFENSSPVRKVVVNAWGSGNFGKKLSRDFLEAEIQAAGECGGEVYQIDDEWQTGGSLGQLALKNVCVPLKEFWGINTEKVGPGGFGHLRDFAREKNVELALWLAPSTNIFYRDHREFADMVLDFHRQYGFNLFKLDNAGFPTLEAERNFETMLRDIRLESDKKVFFNLDITSGIRGGYFRLLEYGSLFVENRYAFHAWGIGYHPERTLRNIWRLARYMRLQSLQMEVASYWDINPEGYAKREEELPDKYSWQYWAAVTLFTNPLLWFSPSAVPAEHRGEIREIMELHKKYRSLIFSGEIFPIGAEPTGSALTGFVSRDAQDRPLAVLLLREIDASDEELAFDTSGLELAAGDGSLSEKGLGVSRKGGFALFVQKEMS